MSVVDETPVRHHATPGVFNLRDTGGYRAASGTSRWGKLFRSDALHLLDSQGRSLIADLGISHIVDLRGSDEQRRAPSALNGLHLRVHHLPVFDDADPAVQAGTRLDLSSIYDYMTDERGTQLADAIRVIATAEDDAGVLVHCTAGKDRTGLVVAFALTAVGVDRRDVLADYAQTESHLRGEWADRMLAGYRDRGAELTPEVVAVVTASPADMLGGLLDRIERQHGSMRGYLEAHGLAAEHLDRLEAVLIARDEHQEGTLS